MKKSQVAMEYIVTYGWALVAVMVLVGGLSFFGVFKPGKTIPETCSLGTTFECKDFKIYVDEDLNEEYVEVYLKNLDRDDYYVDKVQCELESQHNTSIGNAFESADIINDEGILRTNRYTLVKCGGYTSGETIRKDSRVKVKLALNVHTEFSFSHQVVGEVSGKVK